MTEAPRDGERPVVLLFYGYFSGRYDATGPTQSLCRMAQALGDRFRFRVVTGADPGEPECVWGEAFGIERIAVARGPHGVRQLRRILSAERFDLAVHNSFFDPLTTIAPLVLRKLRLVPSRPTIVAPRGEFSAGALALKSAKKSAYLGFARRAGLLRGVQFQATGELEAEAIREVFPAASILIGPNIRPIEPLPPHEPRPDGAALRTAFLSRIDAKKNLHVALDLLAASGLEIDFDIIGPVHDAAYWARCQAAIAALPTRVRVRAPGPVPAPDVVRTLARYDLLLFPTAGENYGHAIVDSLFAGTPVLISDLTPWRGLEQARAGADLPLGERGAWLAWLKRFAAMPQAELDGWRAGARAYVETRLSSDQDTELLARMFVQAMSKERAA